jgi:hypothetical protein
MLNKRHTQCRGDKDKPSVWHSIAVNGKQEKVTEAPQDELMSMPPDNACAMKRQRSFSADFPSLACKRIAEYTYVRLPIR